MDQVFTNFYSKISKFNVSRETCNELEVLVSMILEKNKKINLISRKISEKEAIRYRHIIDSAQIIDFVDLNNNTTTDIGSGGGMPGIIIAIILKNLKKDIIVHLYEKSYHKSNFLKEVSKKLNLNTKIFQKDIFEIKKLETGTIMSRAFKPMSIILKLVHENYFKYNNLIFFMGSSSRKIFENCKSEWNFEFTEKQSITNKDSFLLNVKKIRKKN